MTERDSNGIRTFVIVWFGQLVSLVGSGLFGFAVGVWIYQETGSATLLALMTLFDVLPGLLVMPFTGALADRKSRRLLMMVGDSICAISTITVALLIWQGSPAYWLFYLALALGSIGNAIQWPAYNASVAMLVPEKHLGRANGLMQLGEAVATIGAPLLAGILVVTIGIAGVIVIDFVTFLFAITTVFLVRIPQPEPLAEEEASEAPWWRQATFGWRYIRTRPGLLSLLLLFALLNFIVGGVTVLTPALVLSFATAAMLGIVQAAGGGGMLLGGLAMTSWGGPKRRIVGVLGFTFLGAIGLVLYGLQPLIPLIAVGAFVFFFTLPVVNASSQVIWQSKVELPFQGRVFAVRRMLAQITAPLAYLLAGLAADNYFGPALMPGGSLAGSVGQLIGVGPGRGIGLMFVAGGVLAGTAAILGYLYPRLRYVEDELPDVLPEEEPAVPAVEPGTPELATSA